jgi:hypothetical protein
MPTHPEAHTNPGTSGVHSPLGPQRIETPLYAPDSGESPTCIPGRHDRDLCHSLVVPPLPSEVPNTTSLLAHCMPDDKVTQALPQLITWPPAALGTGNAQLSLVPTD